MSVSPMQRMREEWTVVVRDRDAAVHALDATKQQLLSTANALDQLRVDYESLIHRHDSLQEKMERLVTLSASAVK